MDSAFHYEGADFLAEGVKLAELAEQCGTPLYVYSRAALTENYRALERALAHCAHLICYSVKAASNTAILRLLKDEGSGADIVSEGELLRCLKAGMDPKKIVFSGVGKKVSEMKAALEAGILMFNVESAGEMELLNRAAGEKGVRAPMAFRVNPDVDPQTHPYIATGLRESKFGVPVSEAPELYKTAAGLANLEVIGADCHIGSQLTKVSPFEAAAERMENLLGELAGLGIALKYLDMGGGLGIRYRDEEVPRAEDYGAAVSKIAGRFRDLTLII
ncbi:MAG: diaminopimelate decarboxylase, partial [Deltaproteobacteria bacterium]|nr:diaminopimelate decarboxylase [Deltaproteobacteria bacterium]